MVKEEDSEITPLLKNGIENSQLPTSSVSVSNSLNSSSDLENNSLRIQYNDLNDWIDSEKRYNGKTRKREDENGNWEYETKFISGAIINEAFITWNNQRYWRKTTRFPSGKRYFSLSYFDEEKQKIVEYFKEYENHDKLVEDLPTLTNLNTFETKNIDSTLETKFLEKITVNTINNINQFLENIELFNQELQTFRNNANMDLNVLLKLFKYLTIMQNFIDSSKPPIDTSLIGRSKTIWNGIPNFALGLLQIYIGLIGKTFQRVVSNFPIDGKKHALWGGSPDDGYSESYIHAIFLNWENLLMVLVDTALGTFLTAATSSWSRDVIFNKKSKNNPFKIKAINFEGLKEYKNIFEGDLYEQNHEKLIKRFSQISGISKLMKEFNKIDNDNFKFHPNFSKEVDSIQKVIRNDLNSTSLFNANNISIAIETKHIIASANKTIKQFETPSVKPLTLVENWKYGLATNFGLELTIWTISHIVLTGASGNTTHDDFTWADWPSDIIKLEAIIANLSRYTVMRPVNSIFKAGLETLGIPTNLGLIIDKSIGLVSTFQPYSKFIKLVEKQPKYIKRFLLAPILFLAVMVITSIVKTEAAIVTEIVAENKFEKSLEVLKSKLNKGLTWILFCLVTSADIAAFAISDFYKDVFSPHLFEHLAIKLKIWTKDCGYDFEEKDLKETLTKLEKDGKLMSFEDARLIINTSNDTKIQINNESQLPAFDSGVSNESEPSTNIGIRSPYIAINCN